MEKETRVLDLKLGVEKREDGTAKIAGYAAVFNKDSEDMGFIERIKPGAFKSALKKSDVRALFNHDPNLIIGRSGVNLSLKEDKKGLWMEVSPIPTDTYRMVAENIASGLVTQQSFAFTVSEDEWDEDFATRTIKKIDQVFDVSAVTYPAYPDTSVALRSKDAAMKKENQEEVFVIVDGDSKFEFNSKDLALRIAKKILTQFGADEDESPMADTKSSETEMNSGETPMSNDPQTADELEARFKKLTDKKRGF